MDYAADWASRTGASPFAPAITGDMEALKAAGVPIISGVRTPAQQMALRDHQDANGQWLTKQGNPVADNSKHLSGNAIDVNSKAMTDAARQTLIEAGWNQPLPQRDPNHWEKAPQGGIDYAADWAKRTEKPETPAPKPTEPVKASVPQQTEESGLFPELSRQVGLTARAGLSGIGSTIGIFTNPVDSLLHQITGIKPTTAEEFAGQIADSLGLPKPKNTIERIAQAGASGMASAAGITGLASAAANAATGVGKAVLGALGEAPGMAALSGAGAGAGGQAAEEAGGGPLTKFGASLAGGIGVPLAAQFAMKAIPAAAQKVVDLAAGEKALWTGKSLPSAAEVSTMPPKAIQALENQGISPASVPARALAQIRQDVEAALKTGAPINEGEIARVARAARWDTKLTAAQITQDPALAQAEFNNEGLQAAGKTIRDFKLTNERNFLRAVDEKISTYRPQSNTTPEAAEKVIDTLGKIDKGLKETVDDAYTVARAATGNGAAVPMQPIAQKLGQLHEERGIKQLGAEVVDFLKEHGLLDAQGKPALTQKQTFTVRDADILRKVMNRNEPAATDVAALRTFGEFRRSINDAEGMLADKGDEIGQAAAQAFAKARVAHAARMKLHETVPALEAVANKGAAPDQFLQQFIYGKNKNATVESVGNLTKLLESSGQTQAVNELRADAGRQIRSVMQPRGQWQPDAPISGDAAVKLLSDPVMKQKLQNLMGNDAKDWIEAAQVASDLKFMPSRTHAQVSGNYAAIGSLLEKMVDKPAGGATGTLAEIGKSLPFVGPYANRVAQGFSARGQQNAADAFVREVTSGRIPLNAGKGLVTVPRIPIGALLATEQLSPTPPGKNNERNQNAR